LWHGALAKAVSSGVAVYDTLFVELAIRENTLLATFDAKLLKSFPRIARRPGAVFGQRSSAVGCKPLAGHESHGSGSRFRITTFGTLDALRMPGT
jgi:hypothetical protein